MDWKILLDLVVSVLLVATIGYAVMLNSRLSALRKNRDDLAKTIVAFNEATVRAETAIPKLRKTADDAGVALQERVEKAQSLRDDLAFMIERADTMANRLENTIRSARSEVRTSGPGAAVPVLGGQGTSTLGNPAPSTSSAKPTAKTAAVAAAASAAEFDLDERSEAERELLRALQSMR